MRAHEIVAVRQAVKRKDPVYVMMQGYSRVVDADCDHYVELANGEVFKWADLKRHNFAIVTPLFK